MVGFITIDSIDFSAHPDKYEIEISTSLKPFEIDGWTAHRRDLHNHHNHCRTDFDTPQHGQHTTHFCIGFDRWVDKGEKS